ncbi:MAG: proton-conducting transporter membrane subunit [Candidatus Methylomirabilales bacterium]
MNLFLLGMCLAALGGLAALCAGRSGRWASRLGAGGAVAGSAAALVPALLAVLGRPAETLQLPWSMPGGALVLGLDALSGFFLVPTLVLSGLAALYGTEYLRPEESRRRLGACWLWFDLLLVSMAVVLVARNAILFLLAWEAMALTSFFLVAFDHHEPAVREAGWIYLIATHLGTACLLAMFVLLGSRAGSYDFDRLGEAAALAPASAGLLFLLAVVGFGTKAGFVPLHVWLPEAHPAAPSHVSAVLSGVMIKTGIYGLVRLLTLLPAPPPWWGWLLVGIGVTSGVLGVVFALAQHDLKRLLAYHSVENIGIITLGLGLGSLGLAAGAPAIAVLGFGGGLLHVLNHALFKGLLFLGAGSVLHATGTREIDHLGGLQRRMPWTGTCFLVGAAAISGLPPLNGFASEFLIALAALAGAAGTAAAGLPVAAPLLVLGALALIGGLAAACFTKAFGIVFLGEPRSRHAAHAHEAGPAMRLPMALLAAACGLIGLLAPAAVRALAPTLAQVARLAEGETLAALAPAGQALRMVGLAAALLLLALLGLALLRRRLLAGRSVEQTVTWDCGYAQPTARMQYTASSFAQPLTYLFRVILRTRTRLAPPVGLFPAGAALATETPDLFRHRLFHPAFGAIADALGRLRVLQHGRIQLYVLSIVLTLIALLAWRLG